MSEETPAVAEADRSATISKFAAAFVKAQAEIEGATKDKKNPHFNSRYADLSSVMDACKASLNKYGIGIIQLPAPAPAGRLALTTTLIHESGEWLAGTGEIPVDRTGPQAYGSALTYARRYFLAAMVGVCPEDDDANGATDDRKPPQRPANNPPLRQRKDGAPSEHEQLVIQLHEAMEAKGYSEDVQQKIGAVVLKKHKVATVQMLPVEKLKAWIEAVKAGTFDQNAAA